MSCERSNTISLFLLHRFRSSNCTNLYLNSFLTANLFRRKISGSISGVGTWPKYPVRGLYCTPFSSNRFMNIHLIVFPLACRSFCSGMIDQYFLMRIPRKPCIQSKPLRFYIFPKEPYCFWLATSPDSFF